MRSIPDAPFSIGNLRKIVADLQAQGLPVTSLLPPEPSGDRVECRCLRCHGTLRWCGEACPVCGLAHLGVEFPRKAS